MIARSAALADELRMIIRLAGRDPEALEGQLATMSGFYRVTSAGELHESSCVHFILHRLIPEYLERLPAGRDCRAIRELLTWEDEDGELRSLTTRYHKAAAHLVNTATDFGRRQEPRLRLECARRFIAFDHEDRLGLASAPAADPPPADPLMGGFASLPPEDPRTGIARVHRNLDYHLLVDYMADAEEIVILNTWIPGLDMLADAIAEALTRGTYVSILMLHPDSHIALRRCHSLQTSTQTRFREDTVCGPGIRHCLDVLAAISGMVDEEYRRHLRVRLYDSLPSVSIYGIDDRSFVSVFLHGQMPVNSVQIEVQDQNSTMGRLVFRELVTLWNIAHEFEDVTRWKAEMEDMPEPFGIAP